MIHEIYPKNYDPTYINRLPAEDDFLLCYEKDGILIKHDKGEYSLPRFCEYREICGLEFEDIKDRAYYLFEISGDFYYEYELPEGFTEKLKFCRKIEEAEDIIKEGNAVWFFLRIHSFRELDPLTMVFAGATGYHLRNWRITSKYCGCCGGKTHPSSVERAFVCEKCGHAAYPQISPAVIVAVINGDSILLVKNLRRPKNVRLELVSGYVEIGESFEHAVHREVLEEVGLKVKNLRLYKDQPWGISGAHMIGYVAEVDGDDTVIRQEDEISEAKWYKREEVPEYRNRLSVGSEMILKFREGKL